MTVAGSCIGSPTNTTVPWGASICRGISAAGSTACPACIATAFDHGPADALTACCVYFHSAHQDYELKLVYMWVSGLVGQPSLS